MRFTPFGLRVACYALATATTIIVDQAIAAPAVPTVAAGYFQSRNVRWAPAPLLLKAPGHGEAMSYSPRTHAAGEDFMSATFFPQTSLQISQLKQLSFDMYLPAGSTCAGGSPRMGLVLENPDDATDPDNGSQILIYPQAQDELCVPGSWHTFYALSSSGWGGVNAAGNNTPAQADAAARAVLGDHYRITRVRLYFDAGGPLVWFDKLKINQLALDERARDMTPAAQQPDVNAGASSASVPVALRSSGYFLSRNARWGIPPLALKRPSSGEALHFAPAAHTENANFMAISFFPQLNLKLADLASLSTDLYIAQGSCGVNGPRYIMVAEDLNDTTRTLEVAATWTGPCATAQWSTLNFKDGSKVRLSIDGRLSSGDWDDAARELDAWAPAYRLRVVRLNYVGANDDVWVDNAHINNMVLRERPLDWSPAASVPNPGKTGDGFVANIQFPAQQYAVAEDGVVVLTPDSHNQIKVRVRPYLDGHADAATGAWTGQDGLYEPGYDYNQASSGGYPEILNVAFYANGGLAGGSGTLSAGRDTGLTNVGNGWYEGVITLPAGFQGGAYTVVVNDNYPRPFGPNNSADNRASYFFLAKELLLRGGDASVAPVADLMDSPAALAPAAPTGAAGYSRGYEGPRSPVVIAPLN
jgi:hypothetical protein